ncbi:ribonuclease III [Artomyces pyxidatus]|uniref:Ribonuclease III n=1 Tax=Artomyces pyxidatus TaxID=48021 RepID=A0ACB8TJ02_9AGAM|nr:ribonuclease III [Artomyces pyxidatus]
MSQANFQGAVLNSAIVAICDDAFRADLPNIQTDTWSDILWRQQGPSRHRSERLEFVGDALMYLCIALELYDRFPDATPGFMTVIRGPLVSNLIFSLLAEKMDQRTARRGSVLQPVAALKKQQKVIKKAKATIPKNVVKTAADAMEMAIGALYMEKGLQAVRQWVSRTYDPLIAAAVKTLNERSQSSEVSLSSGKGKKRTRDDDEAGDARSQAKKPRPRSLSPPKHRTISHSRSAPSSRSREHAPVAPPPFKRVFIDLTLDDSDADARTTTVSDMDVSEEEETSDGEAHHVGPSSGPVWIDLTQEDDDDDVIITSTQTSSVFKDAPPSVVAASASRTRPTWLHSEDSDADDESDVASNAVAGPSHSLTYSAVVRPKYSLGPSRNATLPASHTFTDAHGRSENSQKLPQRSRCKDSRSVDTSFQARKPDDSGTGADESSSDVEHALDQFSLSDCGG